MEILKITVAASLFMSLNIANTFAQSTEDSNDQIEWKFETAGPVYASPLISDGTIYIGSLDSTFYALDAKTGQEKWRYRSGNTIQSSAVVHNKLVYFESGNSLFALTMRGKLKWRQELYSGDINNQLDPWDFHHSSPFIHEGIVYIGTEQGILCGFEAKSGERVLRCQTLSEQCIRTTPVVSGNLIFYGDWDGVLYANDINNGSLAWKYDTKQDGTYPWTNAILTSPVVEGENVYFAGKSNRLYSLDARTGRKNWHYSSPTDQWLIGGPLVEDGVVYLGSSDQGLFHAIDDSTGSLLWSTGLDCRIWGRASVKEDRIYIGSNSFYVIDKASGEIRKQYEFPQVHEEKKYGEYTDRSANFHSSPVLFDDMIILGSDDGYIYSITDL
jgi:outer membrane protein assembly factor BamB